MSFIRSNLSVTEFPAKLFYVKHELLTYFNEFILHSIESRNVGAK
jgi:hypothetical protein